MSVKLDTYITKENKISKKQYPITTTDEINIGLLHQVVTSNRTNHRNNTASVKTRAQVSGTGAKPWAQKGTGRARQGSLRSPQFVGGGVAHGPGGRIYKDRTPKKMKRKSLTMALSQQTLDHLLEAEGSLRAAVRCAATNEKPIVVTQLSQLLMDIERVREFEKLQDIVDAEIQKKRES